VVTTSDAIKRIRLLVRDETATVWDDTADMIPRVNDSRNMLWSRKPSAFSLTSIVTTAPTAIASTATDLAVLEMYSQAVVCYAAHLLLAEGRREGDAASAAEMLNLFNLALRGGRAS